MHFDREACQRRVLVVYVFRWGRVVLPGGAVAMRSRCRCGAGVNPAHKKPCFSYGKIDVFAVCIPDVILAFRVRFWYAFDPPGYHFDPPKDPPGHDFELPDSIFILQNGSPDAL